MTLPKKKILIFGASGSVGSQTIEVISRHQDKFQIVAISVNSNIEKLIKDLKFYKIKETPSCIAISDDSLKEKSSELLSNIKGKLGSKTEVFFGSRGLIEIIDKSKPDLVMASIVGSAGLASVLHALQMGIDVALANKEALIMAGPLVKKVCAVSGAKLLTVDSEHSAIFNILSAGYRGEVRSIVLTASGGAFRDHSLQELETVNAQEALVHPTWSMGEKITIDSASLINKGLEVIEAHYLFDLPYEKIDVLIHKESVIHGMVEYESGLIYAELSPPSMLFPISSALFYPAPFSSMHESLDLKALAQLNFSDVNLEKYPGLELCYEAGRKGENFPILLNAANEIAVHSFLRGEISFLSIPKVIEKTIFHFSISPVSNLEDIQYFDEQGKRKAKEIIGEII